MRGRKDLGFKRYILILIWFVLTACGKFQAVSNDSAKSILSSSASTGPLLHPSPSPSPTAAPSPTVTTPTSVSPTCIASSSDQNSILGAQSFFQLAQQNSGAANAATGCLTQIASNIVNMNQWGWTCANTAAASSYIQACQ